MLRKGPQNAWMTLQLGGRVITLFPLHQNKPHLNAFVLEVKRDVWPDSKVQSVCEPTQTHTHTDEQVCARMSLGKLTNLTL